MSTSATSGVAGRYASALFDLADSAKSLDQVAQDLATLRGLIADSPAMIARRGIAYVVDEANYLVRHGHANRLPYMLVYEFARALGFAAGEYEVVVGSSSDNTPLKASLRVQ